MFAVRLSNKALKQVRKLEEGIKNRVLELFRILELKPVPGEEFDLIKLSGRNDSYRIRLSGYRVVYTVFWQEKAVRITKIERRSQTTYD